MANWMAQRRQNLSLRLHRIFSDRVKRLAAAKAASMALLAGSLALASGGCAAYPEAGYGRAYYTPDYSSYYGEYGYGGEPYPAFAGGYGDGLFIGGVRHQGYYGSHHFGHDFMGARGGSFRSGGSHNSGHGGRGGGHR